MTGTRHNGAPISFSKIMRAVKHGDILHAVRSAGPGYPDWDAVFTVSRTTTKGLYVNQDGKNVYLPWPAARHVKVLDSRTWIHMDGDNKTAWTIKP